MKQLKPSYLLTLIALVLLLCGATESRALILNSTSEQASQYNYEVESQEGPATGQNPQNNFSSPVPVFHNEGHSHAGEYQKCPQKQHWYSVTVLPQWALVLASLGYILVSAKQWIAIREQATISLKTLQSMKVIERPWLLFIAKDQGGIIPVPLQGDVPLRFINIRYAFFNGGKTPTWIMKSSATLRIFSRLEDIPEVPAYSESPLAAEIPVGPNTETNTAQAFLGLPLSPDRLRTIARGEEFLVLYGYVHYKDIFGDLHDTGFCSVCRFPLGERATTVIMEPCGPSSYHYHT